MPKLPASLLLSMVVDMVRNSRGFSRRWLATEAWVSLLESYYGDDLNNVFRNFSARGVSRSLNHETAVSYGVYRHVHHFPATELVSGVSLPKAKLSLFFVGRPQGRRPVIPKGTSHNEWRSLRRESYEVQHGDIAPARLLSFPDRARLGRLNGIDREIARFRRESFNELQTAVDAEEFRLVAIPTALASYWKTEKFLEPKIDRKTDFPVH